jgi:hypothetical protein
MERVQRNYRENCRLRFAREENLPQSITVQVIKLWPSSAGPGSECLPEKVQRKGCHHPFETGLE